MFAYIIYGKIKDILLYFIIFIGLAAEKTTESYFELRSTLDNDPGVTPARRRARSHSPKQSSAAMYAR